MAAMLIAGGIMAGASIYGAKKGADAAKNAAKTQAASADTALNLQREQYQQGRQDFAPYQQQGTAAMGRLGQMAQAPRQTFNPGQMASLGNPMGQQAPGGPMMSPGMPQPGQGQMPPQGQPGGADTVLMQGPDGSQRPIPRQYVQQAIQKGARVIQGA